MNALTTIEAGKPVHDWHLLSEIPADRLDGRDVLLWSGRVAIASWCDGWCDAVGRPIRGATHWADAEGPVS